LTLSCNCYQFKHGQASPRLEKSGTELVQNKIEIKKDLNSIA